MSNFKLLFSVLLTLILASCNQPIDLQEKANDHIKPIGSTIDLDYSIGQQVFVPAYSQINSPDTELENRRIDMTVTLSIRNTDANLAILIGSVKYYNNSGTLITEYVEDPYLLMPMASTSYFIRKSDEGGIGANFIVEWGAENLVHEPYIEAIMLGSYGTQGFSWRSTGYVLEEKLEN